MLSRYQGGEQNGTVLQDVNPTWETAVANGAVFGPYISSTTTTMDGVTAKRVDQTQDMWGNLTHMKLYDINSSTLRRQYDQTYLKDTAHAARYTRNRMVDSKVTEASVTTTLVTNVYDNYGPPVNNPIANVINIRQFDSATSTPSLTARGNCDEFDDARRDVVCVPD